jgi:ribosomal protein L13
MSIFQIIPSSKESTEYLINNKKYKIYKPMFEKELVIDAKGHMMGRMAAVIAKELLSG